MCLYKAAAAEYVPAVGPRGAVEVMNMLKVLWCRLRRHPRYVMQVERDLGVWVPICRCPKCHMSYKKK